VVNRKLQCCRICRKEVRSTRQQCHTESSSRNFPGRSLPPYGFGANSVWEAKPLFGLPSPCVSCPWDLVTSSPAPLARIAPPPPAALTAQPPAMTPRSPPQDPETIQPAHHIVASNQPERRVKKCVCIVSLRMQGLQSLDTPVGRRPLVAPYPPVWYEPQLWRCGIRAPY
jgi:hypothetical protein